MRYHLTPLRKGGESGIVIYTVQIFNLDHHRGRFISIKVPSSKNLLTINAGEGVEKREPVYTLGGNVN